MTEILVVDDNTTMREALCEVLQRKGYPVTGVPSGEHALKYLQEQPARLIITDLKMPGMSGIELLRESRKLYAQVPVIVITAYGSIDNAVDAMKSGASDYITKPFSPSELVVRVERILQIQDLQEENRQLTSEKDFLLSELQGEYGHELIIGNTPAMQKIYELVPKIAASKSSVLILGESGTGKELLAWAIHQHSKRKDKSFIRVDCGALPEGTLESELFGHERGAFTGAVKKRLGRFELAHQGTLFLDEIGNISSMVQMRLLRVLQNGEFQRVGGEEPIKVDVRVIAATNTDIESNTREGRFREDLYYRLNVINLKLPPLRERRQDIPALVNYFISHFNKELTAAIKGVAPEVMDFFMRYPWHGNIRELRNMIERAMVLSTTEYITEADLCDLTSRQISPTQLFTIPETVCPPLNESLELLEKTLIERALTLTNGGKSAAARLLGINVTALFYKLHKYGITSKPDEEQNKLKQRNVHET